MSRARKVTVHFTTHACLAADPAAQPLLEVDIGWSDPPSIRSRYDNASVRNACWRDRRRRMNPDRDRYTGAIKRVTCEECRERYAAQLADFTKNAYADGSGAGRMVGSLADAQWLVWRRCCSRVGAPALLNRNKMLSLRRNEVANLVWSRLDARRAGIGGITSQTLADLFEYIPDPLRETIRPAIDDLTMAGDLLAEVERLVSRSGEFVERVVDEINSGSISVDLDAIRDHVIASEERQRQAWRERESAARKADRRAA